MAIDTSVKVNGHMCIDPQNKDVIQDITARNILLSGDGDSSILKNCRFFSGDWKHFCDLLQDSASQ